MSQYWVSRIIMSISSWTMWENIQRFVGVYQFLLNFDPAQLCVSSLPMLSQSGHFKWDTHSLTSCKGCAGRFSLIKLAFIKSLVWYQHLDHMIWFRLSFIVSSAWSENIMATSDGEPASLGVSNHILVLLIFNKTTLSISKINQDICLNILMKKKMFQVCQYCLYITSTMCTMSTTFTSCAHNVPTM